MLNMISIPVFLTVCLLLSSVCGCSQNQNRTIEREAVKQLMSENWEIREKGLTALKNITDDNFKLSKETQAVLMKLITTETDSYNAAGEILRGF